MPLLLIDVPDDLAECAVATARLYQRQFAPLVRTAETGYYDKRPGADGYGVGASVGYDAATRAGGKFYVWHTARQITVRHHQ